jgi:hypothetical protein
LQPREPDLDRLAPTRRQVTIGSHTSGVGSAHAEERDAAIRIGSHQNVPPGGGSKDQIRALKCERNDREAEVELAEGIRQRVEAVCYTTEELAQRTASARGTPSRSSGASVISPCTPKSARRRACSAVRTGQVMTTSA